MADADYRRLSAACFCGDAVKPWAGLGRKPKFCGSHSTRDAQLAEQNRTFSKEQKECPECRGFFTPKKPDHKFCSGKCRTLDKRPPRPFVKHSCAECGVDFESQIKRRTGVAYCSTLCKTRAWQRANPEVIRKQAKPPFSRWHAKFCDGCGKAWASADSWSLCCDCKEEKNRRHKEEARAAARAYGERLHRAEALSVVCCVCELSFCPLYGYKGRGYCAPCAAIAKKAARKAQKITRKAMTKGAGSQPVVYSKVFERDGWCCRLCGIATPKEKRGSYEHDAPELDHIVPLSRGGLHSYSNTQLLCRSCNGWKAARTMEEVEAALCE